MMGIDCFDPADLTALLFQLACLDCSLHGEVSIIFAWIGTAPIRLAGIGFQHRCLLACITTLRAWRERLARSLPQLYALGQKDALARLWEFYFCYCEGGFAEGVLGDVQILLAKPRAPLLA